MDCPRCGNELAIKELEGGRVKAFCHNECYVFEAENFKTLFDVLIKIRAINENNYCWVCDTPKELCICGYVCAGCKEHPNKCKCEELYKEAEFD